MGSILIHSVSIISIHSETWQNRGYETRVGCRKRPQAQAQAEAKAQVTTAGAGFGNYDFPAPRLVRDSFFKRDSFVVNRESGSCLCSSDRVSPHFFSLVTKTPRLFTLFNIPPSILIACLRIYGQGHRLAMAQQAILLVRVFGQHHHAGCGLSISS